MKRHAAFVKWPRFGLSGILSAQIDLEYECEASSLLALSGALAVILLHLNTCSDQFDGINLVYRIGGLVPIDMG